MEIKGPSNNGRQERLSDGKENVGQGGKKGILKQNVQVGSEAKPEGKAKEKKVAFKETKDLRFVERTGDKETQEPEVTSEELQEEKGIGRKSITYSKDSTEDREILGEMEVEMEQGLEGAQVKDGMVFLKESERAEKKKVTEETTDASGNLTKPGQPKEIGEVRVGAARVGAEDQVSVVDRKKVLKDSVLGMFKILSKPGYDYDEIKKTFLKKYGTMFNKNGYMLTAVVDPQYTTKQIKGWLEEVFSDLEQQQKDFSTVDEDFIIGEIKKKAYVHREKAVRDRCDAICNFLEDLKNRRFIKLNHEEIQKKIEKLCPETTIYKVHAKDLEALTKEGLSSVQEDLQRRMEGIISNNNKMLDNLSESFLFDQLTVAMSTVVGTNKGWGSYTFKSQHRSFATRIKNFFGLM